ncbi:MAG: ACT domain-containing protein [Spirochaetes bacterium]|nr:ACT domain-containing protein [Spirochaetota bacterium]
MKKVVLELKVNNHSGVMSHITGLFSRRGFNLEGILCGPEKNSSFSRIYLLVNNNDTLHQIQSQLAKLYDVLEIRICKGNDFSVFFEIDKLFKS